MSGDKKSLGFISDEGVKVLRSIEPMQSKRITLDDGTVFVVMREETVRYILKKAHMVAEDIEPRSGQALQR